MAGILGPRDLPPTPRGVTKSATSAKVTGIAKNFYQQIDTVAQQQPARFNEAMGYGTVFDEDLQQYILNPEAEALVKSVGVTKGYQYLDPTTPSQYEFQGEGSGIVYGNVGIEDQTPAAGEYDIPTSTSNFKRPRTLAAGYDPDTQVVTVVFRDGTFYNYYGINPGTWINFKNSYSKGPLLNAKSKNQANDGLLLRECTARGEADLSQMGEEARDFFVTVARSAQIALRQSSYRNKKGQFAKKRSGGTLGSKKASVAASVNVAAAKKGKNPSKGGKNRTISSRAS